MSCPNAFIMKRCLVLVVALGLWAVGSTSCKKDKPVTLPVEPAVYFAGDAYAPNRMGRVWKNETRETISDGLFPNIRAITSLYMIVYLTS